jgi:hypothetical protein
MKRIPALLVVCAIAALPMGCSKKDKGTTNPDEATAAEGDVDPLAELQSIPDRIQAEVDHVLQPITDVDVVIDQVTTMPSRLGLDAGGLTSLASASLSDGQVEIELDLEADARAEVEALVETIQGIAIGLKEMPQRATNASKNIVTLGGKSAALAAALTAKYQAKLANPLLKADKKAELQAELDTVIKLDAEIKGIVDDAKATVTSLPAKGTEALAKLTAAFAGGASAG